MAETLRAGTFGFGAGKEQIKYYSALTDYNIPRKNGTLAIRILCTILFIGFSFCYLYFYQADILAVAQHVLSGGQTHYSRFIGAVLITLVLWLLQIGIFSLTRFSRYSYAQTYFPSLLFLAVLTDISSNISHQFSFGAWVWLLPLLLIAYGVLVGFLKQLQVLEADAKDFGLFSRMAWFNVLCLTVMFLLVGLVGNHDEVFHYRAHIEQELLDGDERKALTVGEHSTAADASLTMLRAFALSRCNLLGERLFEYPVVGGARALLPNGTTVEALMIPESRIYNHVGRQLKQKVSVWKYFEWMNRLHVGKPALVDYELCACLMDRKMDTFAELLKLYYPLDRRLPKHYREGLTLYMHLRKNPVLYYHDNVSEADYEDFQTASRTFSNYAQRKAGMKESYGNTYWYYYFFCR